MAMESSAFTALFIIFWFSLFTATASSAAGEAMHADEHRALNDLLTSLLADPSWAELHPQPCTVTPWPGIQCDTSNTDFFHVISIHVGPDIVSSPPCKPSASLPSTSLLHLPFLKTLSLFGCFLSPHSASLPPALFANSSSLQHLVLNSNPGLSGEIPSSVSTLRSLTVLSLSQNSFRGSIPRDIDRLKELKQLDLSYNHLSGGIPDEIGGLSSLAILDLSSNELQGDLPYSIGNLYSLQKIDLSFNFFTGRVPAQLGYLERLVLLDLSHNNLTGPLPEELSGLKELEYLIMENNPINISIPPFFASLKKLTVMGLSGCGLLGQIPSFIGSLVSLTALSLDRNRLNGSVPESLGFLPELGQLNLSQNQLSGEIGFSMEFVKRLGKRLDLRGNRDLCVRESKYQGASFRLEAPACLGSRVRNGGNSGERGGEEDGGVRISPSLNGGDVGSCHNRPSFARRMCLQGFAIAAVALLV